MGDCLVWTGLVSKHGYGRIRIERKTLKAHRVVWALHNKEDPGDSCVLHKCDNPSCVNIDHLFLGTHEDNYNDKISKQRQAKGGDHGIKCSGIKCKTHKLNESEVKEILSSNLSGRVLSKKYNISRRQIERIRNKKSWRFLNV